MKGTPQHSFESVHRRRSCPYELVSTVQSSLLDGKVSVGDSCFTGVDNVALCTDATAANPVKCNPAPGSARKARNSGLL